MARQFLQEKIRLYKVLVKILPHYWTSKFRFLIWMLFTLMSIVLVKEYPLQMFNSHMQNYEIPVLMKSYQEGRFRRVWLYKANIWDEAKSFSCSSSAYKMSIKQWNAEYQTMKQVVDHDSTIELGIVPSGKIYWYSYKELHYSLSFLPVNFLTACSTKQTQCSKLGLDRHSNWYETLVKLDL